MLPHYYILFYYTLLYFDVKINLLSNASSFSFLNLSLSPLPLVILLIVCGEGGGDSAGVEGWRAGGVGHAV